MAITRPENRTGERLLFTPGPLTTTRSVREAMLVDIGSWDRDCIDLVAEIRSRLLRLAGDRSDLTCIPMQGSGSFGVEAMLGSAVPRDGKLLILVNGAYGHRMTLCAEAMGIAYRRHDDPEDQPLDPAEVKRILGENPEITHVVAVHCETTSGILNPVREIGLAVGRTGRRFLVDAISSFGAYQVGPGESIDFDAGPIDHLVLSANKAIEGVPGCAFVLSRKDAIEKTAGNARSYCMDLFDQWRHMQRTGQFRTTPPTHVLLAFRQALEEMQREGGIAARAARYRENHRLLNAGMRQLGFREYIRPEHQSYIITTYHHPNDTFDFQSFYDRLHAKGYIIYPGKVTAVDTFRIANIGSIGPDEVRGLLQAIGEVVAEGT